MPIYEFVCQPCGCEFEKIQSFSDITVPTCPRCQSVQVQRQMGRPAIHFKGSGWYITDSKKSSSAVTPAGEKADGNKSNDNSTAGESSSSSSGDAKSSESKPGESKSSESKSGDTKSSESKPESKANAAPASTPAATSSSSS